MMTRDIRLTVDQIYYLEKATRKQIRELDKKIATAQRNRASGQKIQEGTLEEHLKERASLLLSLETWRVAQQHFARQITDKLGLTTTTEVN